MGAAAAAMTVMGVVGKAVVAWGDPPPPVPACAKPMVATGFVDSPRGNWYPDAPEHPLWPTTGGTTTDWNWLASMGLGMSPWSGPGGSGSAASNTPCESQPSACWRISGYSIPVLMNATRPQWGDTRGFPLNLDFYNLPATTNYPPLSQEAWASTAPFVSVPGDRTHRPQFLADRKLVAGVVDPITGQLLIREQDLALPVGRATYRMIRTYGGNADGSRGHFELFENDYTSMTGGQGDRLALGKYWDWAGTGWMISENPILLFDAQYIQHEPTRPRMCYLILDAHHSIPFTQDPDSGNYAAPAWFDAIMTWDKTKINWINGAWSPLNGSGWTHPHTVQIKLYGESVTYTFEISADDITPLPTTAGAPGGPRNAHESPRITESPEHYKTIHEPSAEGGGLGTPYIGLLKTIVDRFGNRVVVDHGTNRPSSLENSGDCRTCIQTCAEKGQIRTVKLYEADANEQSPTWTLVYVHRSFRTWAPDVDGNPCPQPANPPEGAWTPFGPQGPFVVPSMLAAKDAYSKWLLQNAVHAVYVYKTPPVWGAAGPPAPDKWTLPADAFLGDHRNTQQGPELDKAHLYPSLENAIQLADTIGAFGACAARTDDE
jgi:hypothetical protein